ncbi:MAG TPA: PSD1 and planctomycete cytochrome C domain-containing protein, partial [Chthoniobacteraceae bacterium]|nr:PSD1 and planctomycete cytochrome C domain-containing protein [Chthoniobacteraceae bacterium]
MKYSVLFAALVVTTAVADEQLRFFEHEVRPLLSKRCHECHGEKKQKGGLRVDHIDHLKVGGDTGPALVPGKIDESLMIEAIRYKNEDLEMPPKEKLPDAEIAVLEKWVAMGAPWPTTDKAVVAKGGFSDEQRKFWSFQPLRDPKAPDISSAWVRNDIDRFIAQKHAEQKLDPAPEAGRREYVRRAYFDLHGLPPTREQADAFVNNTHPQAYEQLADELLASPRYGERWAQHWLDLVRYAESDGYNQDAYRPAAWPYRDWVIKSLNDDMPYDQFVRQQLAGDEVDPKNPDVLVATGYLRHGIYEHNQRDVKGQWDLIVNDMTDNAGEVFLGLSYGCARCHDHKFDPILQKDYFRLKAFFSPVHWRDDLKLVREEEKARHDDQQAKWESATAGIRAQISAMTQPIIDGKIRKSYERFTEDLRVMIDKKPEERTALERQLAGLCVRQYKTDTGNLEPLSILKKDEEKARYKQLEAELKKFDHLKPAPLPDAFVVTDAAAVAPPTVLKTRKGDTDIAPGFLTLLAPDEPKIEPIKISTGRRTVLANWITRPDNQLTTRVIVNRVWHYHFGRGLVATPNDFGKLGELPSHPELLDWLARRFVAGGWSLKKLHRDIMLSATYRQTAHRVVPELAANIDPSNKYLWRFNPRRLDAEQARDAMLLASGELDLKAGGASVDAVAPRRSIYTIKKRNSQNEVLRSMDAPAGFSSTSERQSTTTPTQALLMVNGDWPLARARKLASRALSIEDAWEYVLGRPPTEKEMETAAGFLKNRAETPESAPLPTADQLANAGQFKENTARERLIARTTEKEGDDFTIEAIGKLDSIDTNAAVRTIASRWSGAKDNVEAFGWSLGVSGEKSRFKPRNLIVQVVGEDENKNIAYEVVTSDLRIELGVSYHIAAKVSCSGHTVTFRVQELGKPNAPVLTSVAQLGVRAKLAEGSSVLVFGGLNKRSPGHQ